MQKRFSGTLVACLALFVLLCASASAMAASYVVAPFAVNGQPAYKYLEQAVPPMLSSRLFWQNKYAPVEQQDAVARGTAITSKDAAAKLLQANKADYVVWGSITIVGDEASIDATIQDAKGKEWRESVKTSVSGMIGGLQVLAEKISTTVFGRESTNRSVSSAGAVSSPTKTVAPLNPTFVVNEVDSGVNYVRGGGDGDTFFRSQVMEYESLGMAVADLDNDGKQEVLLLEKDSLFAYRWADGKLVEVGKFPIPMTVNPLTINTHFQNGRMLILMNSYDKTDFEPLAYILTFADGKFSEASKRLRFFVNSVPVAPSYQKELIGQRGERARIFYGKVFLLNETTDSFVPGAPLTLPKEANVLNFAWLPVEGQGDRLVVVGPQEHLLVFNEKGQRLAKSEAKFSGSPVGVHSNFGIIGAAPNNDDLGSMTYMPMRMLTTTINGRAELVANHPISMAAEIFGNYRSYPQGELEALVWDGLGLEVSWKTRRIKGTVIDFAFADPNNDGILDLVVNVNTYPGTMGFQDVRTTLNVYPLGVPAGR